MSYRINKTDGSLLVDLIDGTINTESSDITLIGRNYKGFGELINENFVKMLENFASSSAPANPLRGQLWYDTTENRLKVYNGTAFITNNIILSATAPTPQQPGDIWLDSANEQLKFSTGGPFILVGPAYTKDQGETGFTVVSVLDAQNNKRVVALLKVNGNIQGVFSKDQFTPANYNEKGKVGNLDLVNVGFNALLDSFRWNGVASKAQTLVDGLGVYRNADVFIRKDLLSASAAEIMTGNLSIQGVNGLQIGSGSLTYSSNKLVLKSLVGNHDVEIQFNKASQPLASAIFIDSSQENVGIKTNTPNAAYALDINGSTRIQGDLTVTGEMTTVNVVDLTVEDKTIELAAGIEFTVTAATGTGATATLTFTTQASTPFNIGQTIIVSGMTPAGYNGTYTVTACTVSTVSYVNVTTGTLSVAGTVRGKVKDTVVDGGGIVLQSSQTDKSLLWQTSPNAWTSSENFNLVTGKEYKINGVTVLSGTSLGSFITGAPGLQTLGTLTNLNVGQLNLSGNTLSSQSGNLQLQAATNIIAVQGSARITGVGVPTAATDAATKSYVDGTGVLSVMLDVTGLGTGGTLNTNIATLLNDLYPAAGYTYTGFNSALNIPARQAGTLARVKTISLGTVSVSLASGDLNTAAQKGYVAVDQTITASPTTVLSVITGLQDPTLGTKVRLTTTTNPYEVGHSVTISGSAGLVFNGGPFTVTAVISNTQFEIELTPFYNFTGTSGATYNTASPATATRTVVPGLANRTVLQSLTFTNVPGTATAAITRGLKQFYVTGAGVWAWDQDLTPGTLI